MKLVAFFAVMCVCLLAEGHAGAQEATEEALPQGFAFKWSAEPIFPAGVHFFITVLRPADQLQSAVLLIEAEGAPPQTVAVSVRTPYRAGETFTDLAYDWAFPADLSPPLGSEIVYEWRVLASNGDQARARDRAVFTDARLNWIRSDDALGQIHLTVAENTSAEALRAALRPVYALLAEQTNISPTFDIIVYPPAVPADGCAVTAQGLRAVAPLSGAALPCDQLRAEAVFRASGQDAVQARAGAGGATAAAVELFVDRFYKQLWQGGDVPQWFRVGLAEFLTPGVKGRYLGPLQRAARTGGLGAQPDAAVGAGSGGLWREQSYAAVLYLADQLGLPGLFELARSAGADTPFAEAFARAMGQPLDALWPAVRRWVLTPEGERAFAYVPYLGDTPTPAASATPTPTRTPTATHTATLTLTPSVTGTLTATYTATRAPTRTPTPGPPTVTPRPPGSLNTPTVTPAPVAFALGDPTTRSGLIAALAAALIAAAAAVLYAGRRR
ncbi:MAG: hypothetical protein ACUVSX_05060 [Aggregatilineales bacterium]